MVLSVFVVCYILHNSYGCGYVSYKKRNNNIQKPLLKINQQGQFL
nr:MAG TPA: hypothetical protein [Caudoviricetes sp.]